MDFNPLRVYVDKGRPLDFIQAPQLYGQPRHVAFIPLPLWMLMGIQISISMVVLF
jgi:hypothetical protein